MFSLVCALPSPASAESCPPLFGWFTGSTAQSDFSGTYMSAVRLVAFADRPCSFDQGVLEISRFSCMLFLSVRGFLDYAGPTVHSRLAWLPCCLPPTRNEVGILIYGLFAAQSPRPPMPLSTLQATPRDVPSKTRGQDGFATSFPVGLLHPQQHAGLSALVAVGTTIADRPPHRTVLARLRIRLLRRMSGVKACVGIGVQNSGWRNPPVQDWGKTFPTHLCALTAADQNTLP